MQQKLASATAGGLPLYLWENAGAGQCSKKLERAFGKMQGQGSAVKNWRALPLGGYPIFGKMQGQGSAVQDWRALLGGYPSIFGKNAGAGQCSKNWLALLGGYPSILGKNAGAGQCSKKLASATSGGRPLYHKRLGIRDSVHLLTIVLPSALATANRITKPGSASDSAHSRRGAVQLKIVECYRWTPVSMGF